MTRVEELSVTEEAQKRRPSPTSRARKAAAAGLAPARETVTAPRPEPTATTTDAPAAVPTKKSKVAKTTVAKTTVDQTTVDSAPLSESVVEDESVASPGRTLPRQGSRRVGWPLAIVLVLIVAVLLATNVLLLRGNHRSTSAADRGQVLAAAKSDTTLVISYSYQTVAADEAKALPHLTGAFASDYQKSMDQVIKVQAPKVKAVVQGQIDSAAIEAVSPNGTQVTVIVFGQQQVTNSSLTQPRVDLVRLRVTMDRVGAEWKISQLAQI